jgi:hypothetical protein
MVMPFHIQQQLDKALACVRTHPHHELIPMDRRSIYDALIAANSFQRDAVRAWLALLTARYVLPIWHQANLASAVPDQVLAAIEHLIAGSITIQ